MINLIILASALATFSWRAAATVLARRVRADSLVFKYAACITYGIVGALIIKIIIYPQGTAADSDLYHRFIAIGAALAVYKLTRRNIALSAWAGSLCLFLVNSM